jgi:DnaJ-class molecular chaperone
VIRAGVLPDQRVEVRAECPTCQGRGEVLVQRLFGRNAPEPYLMDTCGACGGTGSVPVEQVESCDDCGRSFWRGEGCDHHGATVCRDCALPNCHDCVDVHREAS